MTGLHRYTNGQVVVGDACWPGVEIAVEDQRIAAIRPLAADAGDAVDLAGGWIMPGFVDTQVNGGGGVLFNDQTSVDGIAAIGAAHARYGTTAFMPTLISDTPDRIALALDAMDDAIAAGVPGVVGVHIEGPFLNVARKGIHDAERFIPLDDAMVALLARPRRGRVMVTLAPELAEVDRIATLAKAGVLVSAGHSEASYDTMIAAFDAGLTGITHLFNAMPPMVQRVPGLVGAALDDPRPWCGLIVDGVHVAPAVLRIALKARGTARMMLVTDAMSSVGALDKDFVLQGRAIRVADGICSYEDGTLAGSDLDMAQAAANAMAMLGLDPVTVAQLAAANPAAFLGLSQERGALAVGLRADWVQLSTAMAPVATFVGGKPA
ncbi:MULTISPECIES: N-acetylglucosamine-6-phosphate deacetylase [unclassified Sphingomonas]|jgi:N-acetylglucosamine-6-phosphate deacetylase|uniref:N-acetylglucosamine-6-phosphate deacetylase n=1 Tax=unclassified Sphingomonas TaxID=196159 RepID=UPI000E106A98|nr:MULTISPECIES: N-acetylglucosamine-6-phosphate deacetylase [unclassified Sphingomonas]AXJ95702.1 N-acetylglucosamine-6-phosphate deacetylase [Sphingomonas sp. FARSPH]